MYHPTTERCVHLHGVLRDYTLRETTIGCFYTNVIPYNGNYKSNWHHSRYNDFSDRLVDKR